MTSIEWLIEKLYQHEYHIDILDVATINGYFDQAKEMHKQEIMDAYDKGEFDCGCNGTGEDYYNKTFKNQQ